MSLSLFNKDNTFGAAFVGFGASSVALGIDHFTRALSPACGLWSLLIKPSLVTLLYFYVVTNWGDEFILLDAAVWSLIIQVTLGAIVGAIVKTCFAVRVWRFSNNNLVMTGLIDIAAFVFTVRAFQIRMLTQVADLKVIGSLSLGLGVATDVVTAASLCYFLRKLRTGYSRDDSLINSLTLYAINTGVITSAISLCTLICYDLMPDNFVFMGLYFILSKLYANSFMATLNTRKSVRGRGTDGEHTTMPTFLMVEQVTKKEVHIDPDISTGSAMELGIRQEVSLARQSIGPGPTYYAQAW
ncbi:hypothetical protein A0H81_05980 [Grifola frondosa]|uniref:DUF6534 domain-containing protein n=1 Tax=Grifola frondosa TaxID=5627 RepID=A0A1C7MC96_GRIFR|nr:hypothetical protein A0H81_05980 [Grifola frondosa]